MDSKEVEYSLTQAELDHLQPSSNFGGHAAGTHSHKMPSGLLLTRNKTWDAAGFCHIHFPGLRAVPLKSFYESRWGWSQQKLTDIIFHGSGWRLGCQLTHQKKWYVQKLMNLVFLALNKASHYWGVTKSYWKSRGPWSCWSLKGWRSARTAGSQYHESKVPKMVLLPGSLEWSKVCTAVKLRQAGVGRNSLGAS